MPKKALSLAQLDRQLADLNAQRDALMAAAKAKVVGEVQEIIAAHGLTATDLFGSRRKTASGTAAKKKPVGRILYRDKANGHTWTGRGPKPKWLKDHESAGGSAADFKVKR